MSLLNDDIKKQVKEALKDLTGDVYLSVFTQEFECNYCKDNKELALDVGGLSDKIHTEVFDFVKDSQKAEKYGVDKIPAIIVRGKEKDYGVKFFGIPAGYEFTSFMEAIKAVSLKEGGGKNEVSPMLLEIKKPVHLKIFVTPTCPYCPGAVVPAHKFAIENANITAEMVEATEFPHLSNKYNVMGVPRIIINETEYLEGAVPEDVFIEKILETIE
jgi:glutaredoxin-like protein